jgi:HJR/Mrr/RecB family endonuclease
LNRRLFEEFVAELFHEFGYEVELTKRTRDGGRDVIAIREAEAAVLGKPGQSHYS